MHPRDQSAQYSPLRTGRRASASGLGGDRILCSHCIREAANRKCDCSQRCIVCAGYHHDVSVFRRSGKLIVLSSMCCKWSEHFVLPVLGRKSVSLTVRCTSNYVAKKLPLFSQFAIRTMLVVFADPLSGAGLPLVRRSLVVRTTLRVFCETIFATAFVVLLTSCQKTEFSQNNFAIHCTVPAHH